MTIESFAIVALFIIGFGLISGWIENTIITAPMVFVTFGLLISPNFFNLVDINIEQEIVKAIAEFTLISILFIDASRIKLNLLRKEYQLPMRMVTIGILVTIILGTIFGFLLFQEELNFWEVAVLATILTPTDAALGQAVITSEQVPICIRQSLNAESGLNDGICLPIFFIFLSLAKTSAGEFPDFWLSFTVKQLLLGPIVGILIAYIGGALILESARRDWITNNFKDLSVLGLSLCAYALAELLGGNGFIAVFCGGLTLGNTARSLCQYLYDFGEAEGELLILITFIIFGSSMVFPALEYFNWQVLVYSVFMLGIARIVGVCCSVIGMNLRFDSILFLGWFGPKGIASLLYGLFLLEESGIQGSELIFSTMVITVLISVFAHGISALPGAYWYGKRLEKVDKSQDLFEFIAVKEMPMRLYYRRKNR